MTFVSFYWRDDDKLIRRENETLLTYARMKIYTKNDEDAEKKKYFIIKIFNCLRFYFPFKLFFCSFLLSRTKPTSLYFLP